MDVETEVKDIKQNRIEISGKLDELMHERESISLMRLSDISLADFEEDEPDIYKMDDVKVKYR